METERKSWYFKSLSRIVSALMAGIYYLKACTNEDLNQRKSTVDKNYLSREGYEKLEEELKDLKTRGRQEIAEEIAEARAKGDLSENAEYDAAKEAQGMLEKRIAELENALANARILDEEDIKTDKAYLLSTVTIYNHNVDKEVKYTLVSKDEANFKKNKISVESPIGKAILGREVGETFEVDVPAGKLKLEVKNIER